MPNGRLFNKLKKDGFGDKTAYLKSPTIIVAVTV